MPESALAELRRRRRWARIAGVVAALLVLVVAAAWPHRAVVAVELLGLFEGPPPLLEPQPELASVQWFDDYFTVEWIDPKTIAIAEPRYWQQNHSYLILGEDRAVLFDSGPGLRKIKPVVESLTELPVTAVPSHFHFDHIGNHTEFDRIALVDLPHLRERAPDGILRPSRHEHLGFLEGFERPSLVVSEWWAPGSAVDLGGRTLEVVHTPGHTPESIALLDREHWLLFTGDYIYPGPLFAFVPGSDLGEYLDSARGLSALVPPGMRLLGAHREAPPGAPILDHSDLVDLRAALELEREGSLEGEGFYLKSYPINERLYLLAEAPWASGRWR